ncbi:hypothetical protein NDU88_002458 [Pleurodeles waltl]|uniref:Uncharacterized protein n=1 Tax=Pleurodeles waltl TaxID=8319 RepID=A0AAV7NGG0_PLEWA|nr:hypothetical protein NDU88_002458 [Pleurodeles waltl]
MLGARWGATPPLGIQSLSPCAYCLPPAGGPLGATGRGCGPLGATTEDGWAHRTFLGGGYPDTLVGAGTLACPLLPVTIGSPGRKGLQLSRVQCQGAWEGGCPHDLSSTPRWTTSQTLCSLPAAWDGAWQIHYTDGVATRGPGLIAVILEARRSPRGSGTARLGRHI